MDWRDKLDPTLKEHFNDLLKKVHSEKEAYTSAQHISQAQLWCAIAVLMKEVSDLQLQVKSLEKHIRVKPNSSLKNALDKL
ncbi:hypothetical protein EXS74_01575 [Candidatus Woesearchaeota archaeon]|nr:hypothetical protein [Candidatus Woesearchaeota archaeon]